MVLSGLGGARRRAGRGHRRAALVDAVLVRRVIFSEGKARQGTDGVGGRRAGPGLRMRRGRSGGGRRPRSGGGLNLGSPSGGFRCRGRIRSS
jgi:hypothetical protein